MSETTGDMTSAVEAAFAASATPAPASTTTTEQPASATETPAGDVSQAAPQTEMTTKAEPGPIPYPRFKEVNDKWTTASKELEGLGWAKGVNPQLAQSAIQLLTRAQQNPLAFTEELEALRDHPQFGPQLRSWAARTLGFRNQRPAETAVDEEPQPDIPLEDGRQVYSSERQRQRDQWLMRQMESKFDEKLQPLTNKSAATEKYVADQVYAGIEAKAHSSAKTELDSLRQQYPQFAEHEPAIKALMIENPTYTLKQAWAEVFIKEVGPALAGQHAATVKQKVSAGSANPARPSGASKTVPSGFREHLEQLLTGTS